MLAQKSRQFIAKNSGKLLYFLLFLAILYNIFFPAELGHANESAYAIEYHAQAIPQVQNRLPEIKAKPPEQVVSVRLTAYSSTIDQCDSSPFITASGTAVHDGTIAANCLAFGTKVKIPAIYGDKIFIVEDRLAGYLGCGTVDIWFADRSSAMRFGRQFAEIEIY